MWCGGNSTRYERRGKKRKEEERGGHRSGQEGNGEECEEERKDNMVAKKQILTPLQDGGRGEEVDDMGLHDHDRDMMSLLVEEKSKAQNGKSICS